MENKLSSIITEIFDMRKTIQQHTKDLIKEHNIKDINATQGIYDFALDMYLRGFKDAIDKMVEE